MQHKTIKLWTSTRKTGNILSGNEKLNPKITNEIKELTGMKITQNDIEIFSKILKRFPIYQNRIYRGIFEEDEFYKELVKNNSGITKRYYSFTKSLDIAKLFGNKIILSIDSCKSFDISKFSKENEVILDKNTHLYIKSIEKIGEYTIINLYV